jgi:hypothetical protein
VCCQCAGGGERPRRGRLVPEQDIEGEGAAVAVETEAALPPGLIRRVLVGAKGAAWHGRAEGRRVVCKGV